MKPDTHRNHLFRKLTWGDLDLQYLKQLIALARSEDLEGAGLNSLPQVPGDVSTLAIAPKEKGHAKLIARHPQIVCGLPLVPLILQIYGHGHEHKAHFEPKIDDGTHVESGNWLGTLHGPVSVLLQAERVILNFLQHLSGIATQTHCYVTAMGTTQTRLLDTRKTTPGFRVLEKYAVACGGAWNHRMGLYDRVMLKDNHLASSGATQGERLAEAVRSARHKNAKLAIEVEVDELEQIPPVLSAGADVIMLDNFSDEETVKALALIGNQCYSEASGGITLERLPKLAQLGLDFISSGALIHQAQWTDIGLDWDVI